MSVNATRYIISMLGCSLVVERRKVLEYSRKAGRSDTLVRQILHKLRKKSLVYVHRNLIVNIPLLLSYYYLSYCSWKGDDAVREVTEALISEGIEDKIAANLVSKIVNTYLDTYKKFVRAMQQYYEEWLKLVRILKERGTLNSVNELLLVYLGCLVPEGAKLIEIEHGESDLSLVRLRDEFLGTRLFLASLARLVEDKRIVNELHEVKKRLTEEIERLKSSEDRYAQRFATIFLEQTIASAMNRIFPKFYVILIAYRKGGSGSGIRGKTRR